MANVIIVLILVAAALVWILLHGGAAQTVQGDDRAAVLPQNGNYVDSQDASSAPLVLGAIVGVLNMIPYFGPVLGGIPAVLFALGFGWKAGIAAEVLTVPGVSIGRMIYESKLYLQTTDLFAWTLCVILLSFLLEKLVLRLISGGGKNA